MRKKKHINRGHKEGKEGRGKNQRVTNVRKLVKQRKRKRIRKER